MARFNFNAGSHTLKEYVCTSSGKIPFLNFQQASKAVRYFRNHSIFSKKEVGVYWKVYHCKYCSYFHLTRETRDNSPNQSKKKRNYRKH